MFSDVDIREALTLGSIIVNPYDSKLLQPASIDVRLDRHFRIFDNYKYSEIDPSKDQTDLTRLVSVDPEGSFVLHPGSFVLASTYETVALSDEIASRFEGKSSLGRLGLITHVTAGFIDPGFSGNITLELANVAHLPIRLYPGMKIGQLCFFGLKTPASAAYGAGQFGSHYQSQIGPTPSMGFRKFTRTVI
jgi:dCTP deaminase